MTTAAQPGRLEGRITLINGDAGSIADAIARRFLAAGATVVVAGRDAQQLAGYRQRLLEAEGIAGDRVVAVPFDGSDMDRLRTGVAQIVQRLGHVDVLVSCASGARGTPVDIALSAANTPPPDVQSLADAVDELVGMPWNLTRALAPHLHAGASIIHVAAPAGLGDLECIAGAALRTISAELARELAARGVRVNTLLPAAPESDSAAAASQLPAANATDIANAALFLASEESAAFSGHRCETAAGMGQAAESRTTFTSRPGLRAVDASATVILICAGDQVDAALDLADELRACRATVAIGFRDPAALDRAETLLRDAGRPESIDMYGRPTGAPPPLLLHLDPLDPQAAAQALDQARDALGTPRHVVVFPARGSAGAAGCGSLVDADDRVVDQLLREELGGAVTLARLLTRFWSAAEGDSSHRVLFITNPDDGRGNHYADVLRSAIEQLCRLWRHDSAEAPRAPKVWCNQLVRYSNSEAAAGDFASAWVARLLASAKRIDEINLYLPSHLAGSIGIHTRGFGYAESLFGLHMGKVALITGGSAGIGGQIGRLLAVSGAFVVLAARRAEELERMREQIVGEVRDAGYLDAQQRVVVLPGCDVAEESAWTRIADQVLERFGRCDYLINNAGIAGAEEMVIDMPHEAWRHTLKANLISNYALIRLLAPAMKQNGGHIVNVSSYFGGEKYVAIPYPNRSDYAVSKAGQRALAEALARFMGPQVQINALAPGPVEGDRLKGSGARPGLFARRARLILENKRLNDLHAALIAAHRDSGAAVGDLLPALAANQVQALADGKAPAPLRRLAAQVLDATDPAAAARTYLMNETIARKLERRLEVGGHLRAGTAGAPARLAAACGDVPDPFFAQAQIDREAAKVRDGILGMLDLRRMPTEFDVALATVFYLADRNVTGETFHPSGGLNFERTVSEGELFGKPDQQRLQKLAGTKVFLIGEHLHQHLTALAQCFLDDYRAARVVLITETEESARALTAALPAHEAAGRLVGIAAGSDIEGAIDRACIEHGQPGPVVSTPFRPLPQGRLAASRPDWSDVLTTEDFTALVEHQITHHFRVAQKASLIDGANLTLVTPPTSARSTAEEFALGNFVKTTLHALTATLGAESERTAHHVPVNQVDLTRRARNEEPQNATEEQEELARFATAVLLTSAPLPTPKDSRYRSRIYRGKAITV